MNIYEGNLALKGSEKIAILASRFNSLVVDKLVDGAKDCFLRHNGKEENLSLVLVPGAFELPFCLQKLIDSKRFDGVCILGAIIRGDTPHFDYVSAEATKGIANVTLNTKALTSFGLLTTDSIDQALNRAGLKAGNKGYEAMASLIEMLDLYNNLKS